MVFFLKNSDTHRKESSKSFLQVDDNSISFLSPSLQYPLPHKSLSKRYVTRGNNYFFLWDATIIDRLDVNLQKEDQFRLNQDLGTPLPDPTRYRVHLLTR